jgi:integrase
MLGTDLRVGEATGLRWKDIDFENNVQELCQ